jgi:hypothetical protein
MKKIDMKLENWLVKKCKITAWRDEQGRALYEGEFVTESVTTAHAPYTVLSVQFYAPSGKGPQIMRKAVQRGARTGYALRKEIGDKGGISICE